jgi:hypothetical protein
MGAWVHLLRTHNCYILFDAITVLQLVSFLSLVFLYLFIYLHFLFYRHSQTGITQKPAVRRLPTRDLYYITLNSGMTDDSE